VDLADGSETDGRAKRLGFVHGLLNIAATALMAAAYVLRRRSEGTLKDGTVVCPWHGIGVPP
jgi:hypothetical protein